MMHIVGGFQERASPACVVVDVLPIVEQNFQQHEQIRRCEISVHVPDQTDVNQTKDNVQETQFCT